MVSAAPVGGPDTDNAVDLTIKECLSPDTPRSFFLYAGAGSGKTYSLIEGLKSFKASYGARFKRSGQKVAVITYTNAACDEILDRVEQDPLFHISTIHSFCWQQIKVFHDDIRRWLQTTLPEEIAEWERLEERGRPGTKASIARQRSIAAGRERLDWLAKRREFTYNPNGDNIGKASLSHSEVLKVTSNFLTTKSSFQQLVVNRYPFLLIDESQDTNKLLVEAFFDLEEAHHGHFGLGLIGDMMQRIYGDGKPDLGANIPKRWATPVKQMNRRCPSRIVALANDIRHDQDQQTQMALEGNPLGLVRLFIAPFDLQDKSTHEAALRRKMADRTGDNLWRETASVKHLMLEHMMAATRMGFAEMYSSLRASNRLATGLNTGELPAVRLFSEAVLPLYQLHKAGAAQRVMAHLRRFKSPLVDPQLLKARAKNADPLAPLKTAIQAVTKLVDDNPEVKFVEVLECVASSQLFPIPDSLSPFAAKMDTAEGETSNEEGGGSEETEDNSSGLEAIGHFLDTPFKQIEAYRAYVSGEGPFDTHQGVKGREFDRVMVVMDDEAAGGFLFSYEKLFEVKPPTKSDKEKLAKGEETGLERTRRLFYVTCTRAKQSLALVAYTQSPESLRNNILAKGWFEEGEIELT